MPTSDKFKDMQLSTRVARLEKIVGTVARQQTKITKLERNLRDALAHIERLQQTINRFK